MLPAAVDDTFERRCPALYEMLTCRIFEGKARETGTVLIFCEDGLWKACISDRDNDRVLFRACGTLDGLWEALEGALESPAPDWRARKGKR
jgi:hypothetical protein